MNEILKKRIEEAAINGSKHYDPNISKYSQGKQVKQVGYIRGFKEGAEYALSHQWISVEEALPKCNELVIARNLDGEIFPYYSNQIDSETDNKWHEIVMWMYIPKFNK